MIHVKPLRRCAVDNGGKDRTGTFMSWLRRKRTGLAALCFAVWFFSFAVGAAHACGVLPVDHEHAAVSFALRASAEPTDSNGDAACVKFCADDVPLVAKLTAVQDQPSGQALLLPALLSKPLLTGVAPVASLSHRPRPPPGIALNTRFVRLAL